MIKMGSQLKGVLRFASAKLQQPSPNTVYAVRSLHPAYRQAGSLSQICLIFYYLVQ